MARAAILLICPPGEGPLSLMHRTHLRGVLPNVYRKVNGNQKGFDRFPVFAIRKFSSYDLRKSLADIFIRSPLPPINERLEEFDSPDARIGQLRPTQLESGDGDDTSVISGPRKD